MLVNEKSGAEHYAKKNVAGWPNGYHLKFAIQTSDQNILQYTY